MPTYEYICNACGHEFELFQTMSAPVKKKCPECSKLKLERLIGTGAGIIFKGGGFYETDYRSDSYKKDAEAEKNTATKSKDDSKKSGSSATKSSSSATSESAKPSSSSDNTPKPKSNSQKKKEKKND